MRLLYADGMHNHGNAACISSTDECDAAQSACTSQDINDNLSRTVAAARQGMTLAAATVLFLQPLPVASDLRLRRWQLPI